MDLSKSVTSGTFAKADIDIKQGDVITIMDEGVSEPSQVYTLPDGTPKINYNFTIKLVDGKMMKLTINKTSLKNLVGTLGAETGDWIGKEVKANIAMTPKGQKMVILEALV